MKIDIALPTYNRATFLLKNIRLIQDQLKKDNLFSYYTLSVSDNCSTDETQLEVEKFIKSDKDTDFEFYYNRNSENIGIERNSLKSMQICNNEFIMTIGDDDFLDEGYLKYIIEKINANPDLGCIITGLISVSETEQVDIRNLPKEEYFEKKGFQAMLNFSHYGHQLSGLVYKRENLIESYLSFPQYQNIYLFIYFTAYSCLHHDTIFVPKFKTRVTIGNAKDWKYDQSGNLVPIYKSYYPFIKDIGLEKVIHLITKFTLFHSDRLRLKPFFPFQGIGNFNHLIKNIEPLPGLKSALRKTFLKIWLSSIKRKITN